MLDLTDPAKPRYAEHRGDHRQNVGSVGKLVGRTRALPGARRPVSGRCRVPAAGAEDYGGHRRQVLAARPPRCASSIRPRTLIRRAVQVGDRATLYEWLDWMLSPSSNSAAGMVMREVMFVRRFGKAIPRPRPRSGGSSTRHPRPSCRRCTHRTFHEPVTRNGLDIASPRQGSFFTATGKPEVPGVGDSYGTARELMRYLLRMEQGRIVDSWSSREIKRLLYVTERRIRYASSPALADAAVYFKSGSLFECANEAGFTCQPYAGNVKNYMNSTAIVESPAAGRRVYYISTLVTNILRKNSAGRAPGAGDAPAAADRGGTGVEVNPAAARRRCPLPQLRAQRPAASGGADATRSCRGAASRTNQSPPCGCSARPTMM